MVFQRRGLARLAAATLAALLAGTALNGCGGSGDSPADDPCAAYRAYQGHDGTTVSILSPIRDVESDKLARAWETLEECSGITIDYQGTDTFEKRLPAQAHAGRAPDLAVFPQPGLLREMVEEGYVKPVSPAVNELALRGWSADWLRYARVGDTLYAAPLDASVKSLVWYSPRWFREKGYTVPRTWPELMTLTKRIADDGVTPWCAGIESGVATGWPVTDWLEDVLLRTAGAGVYDDWVNHKISFTDPRVVEALNQVGTILRNPRYVNGGYGGVRSMTTISFQEGGLPILERKCAMHRQASFYANWWPENATVGESGDIYAFYLPPMPGRAGPAKPVLGAGNFVAAFNERPEVTAVATYLASPEFANEHARTGEAISGNRGLDPASLKQPVARLSAELLRASDVTFRFDGSDLMPASVGSGTFWRGMTEWINGAGSREVLAEIQRSWPD